MTLNVQPDFTGFSGPDGTPTGAERLLIEANAAGRNAGCTHLAEDERIVSAALISALATGSFRHKDWPNWQQHPAGLKILGAKIDEKLALENCRVTVTLTFIRCTFERGFNLNGAVLAGDLFIDDCQLIGECSLVSATISGRFSAIGSTFENPGRDAILAYGAKAAIWFMNRAEVEGCFDINGAEIAGQFNANNANFSNENKDAILAYEVKASSWFMDGVEVKGNFNIGGAEIAGQFSAENAKFSNPQGIAFGGHFAQFRGGLVLRGSETSVHGDFVLSDATIHQILNISEATFRAGRYRALRLQGATILGDANCTGATVYGHIDASRASFGGRFTLEGSRLIASSVARQEGDLDASLHETFHEFDRKHQDKHRHHALILKESRIAGRLVMPKICPDGIVDLSHARCEVLDDHKDGWPNPIDPKTGSAPVSRIFVEAVEVDGKTINREVDIRHLVLDGFKYEHFEHPDGTPSSGAMVAESVSRPGGLLGFLAGLAQPLVRVFQPLVRLFRRPEDPASIRKYWLAAQPADDLVTRFNPQPWRQAASVLRAMGHDRASQGISIERRVRERHARDTPGFQRFQSWMLHRVADYGYNPWKTAIISVCVVLACATAYWGGTLYCGDPNGRGALAQCNGQPLFVAVQHGDVDERFGDGAYPAFGPIAYSLDTFVPLFDFATEIYWRVNTDASVALPDKLVELAEWMPERFPLGLALYWLFIAERFLGAILIAIAVTGFTGLLTRDEK